MTVLLLQRESVQGPITASNLTLKKRHRICQKIVRKLRDEFKVFESAFDAYESALDELQDKNDNDDVKTIETYFTSAPVAG